MRGHAIIPIIQEIAEPIIASMDGSLWGVRVISGKGSRVQIFIEHPEGVTIEHCTALSRAVSNELDLLEGEGSCPVVTALGSYVLEVSTPGIERHFFSIQQLPSYIGDKIEILLHAPMAISPKQRRYKGTLASVANETITIMPIDSETIVEIVWDNIERMQRIHF